MKLCDVQEQDPNELYCFACQEVFEEGDACPECGSDHISYIKDIKWEGPSRDRTGK